MKNPHLAARVGVGDGIRHSWGAGIGMLESDLKKMANVSQTLTTQSGLEVPWTTLHCLHQSSYNSQARVAATHKSAANYSIFRV
jgi:hypothetical protein